MALAHAHYNRRTDDPERSLAEVEAPTDEAIERDPADPFAHGVAVLVAMYRKDFGRRVAEVGEALLLNPNVAPALSLRATLNICSGSPGWRFTISSGPCGSIPHFAQGYLARVAKGLDRAGLLTSPDASS
jgi:hypothetical protein